MTTPDLIRTYDQDNKNASIHDPEIQVGEWFFTNHVNFLRKNHLPQMFLLR